MFVVVFALVGVGLAVVGFAATNWATTLFLLGAQGETAARFGPVFVALLAFVLAVVVFVTGPVLAVLLGILFGSRLRTTGPAAGVTAAGSFLGVLAMGALALPGVLAGVGGGASAPFGLPALGLHLLLTAVTSAAVGGLAGAVGVRLAD